MSTQTSQTGNGTGGGNNEDPIPALVHTFKVVIDSNRELGYWGSVSGLDVEVDVTPYEEGGVNEFVHNLRGRIKYQNVTLKRFMYPGETAKVARWFAELQQNFAKTTAAITAFTSSFDEIYTWNLDGVYPVKWSGPQLDASGNNVAEETLELAHDGFLHNVR